MKYNIISFFVCFLVLSACTKDAEYDAAQDYVYTPKKNAYRAVKISGTNSHWGDFNLSFTYSRDELDVAYRTNSVGDTVGRISVDRNGSTYLEYYVWDYIPSVDKDSVNRIDKELTEKYGAGNYHLWDSLPKTSRTIEEVVVYLYPDGRVKKQINYLYRPNANADKTGKDFDNTYILVSRNSYAYEYNTDSDICINRLIRDLMNPKDKDIYERLLYKDETIYDGDRITGIISYAAGGGESFTEINRYSFIYNGDKISAINGNDFSRLFTYSGSAVTITTNGKEAKYEFDGNGNVTKIDDGKGNIFNITYEAGNGNISIFSSLFDIQTGVPYIK